VETCTPFVCCCSTDGLTGQGGGGLLGGSGRDLGAVEGSGWVGPEGGGGARSLCLCSASCGDLKGVLD